MNTHWHETRKAINAFKNATPKAYDVIWKNAYWEGMQEMYHHCKQMTIACAIGVAVGAVVCTTAYVVIDIANRRS